jgi:hypothetical protein
MVEGNHEGNDVNSLFDQKHCKIRQNLSHASKDVATHNIETLIPWSYKIQNGL